jgi:hypothetical protein
MGDPTDVDPVAALRTFLLADDVTADLVGTRIYGQGIMKKTDRDLMPAAAVVLNAAGGPSTPGGGFTEFGMTRVDAFCYGSTLNESWKVYRAVLYALKQLTTQEIDSTLVHSVTVSSKGVTAMDPVTQWPLTLASFLVLAAEID